jgi:hypothetical protein
MSLQAQKQADNNPKIQVKGKKIYQEKNHCRYRQWLWASLGPSAVSLHAHNQADGQLKILVRKLNFTRKKPLPVPAMAVSKPRAISCELTCSQSSWWSAQNSREKIKIKNENTTAGTGSGFEQA